MKCRGVNLCFALKIIYYQLPLETFLLSSVSDIHIHSFIHSFILETYIAPLQETTTQRHNTRTKDHYRTDFARTNSRLFSIRCSGLIAWNSLPSDIRRSPTLFKKSVRKFLMES